MNAIDYVDLPYGLLVALQPTTHGRLTYVAENPELSGCRGQGDTPEAAIASLREARLMVLELMIEQGEEPLSPAPMRFVTPLQPDPAMAVALRFGPGVPGSLTTDDLVRPVYGATLTEAGAAVAA